MEKDILKYQRNVQKNLEYLIVISPMQIPNISVRLSMVIIQAPFLRKAVVKQEMFMQSNLLKREI